MPSLDYTLPGRGASQTPPSTFIYKADAALDMPADELQRKGFALGKVLIWGRLKKQLKLGLGFFR
jgi:hypothetical protein